MWTFLCYFTVLAAWIFAFEKRIFDVTNLPVQSIIIKAGENKSLACPGVNEHSLVIALEWLSLTHNVKLVEFMSDSTTVWVNQHRIALLPDTFGLSFHPAIAEDSGDYVCLVNSRPKPDGIVRLIVQDVPDAPGRPLIVSFTSRSVNLSWAPSQDTHHSPITHYIIHTRVGENGEWNVIDEILTPNNESSYQVTSLHPYTVYSFRVVAVNAMGASQPSKESYYMVTLREAPAGKPTITTAHNTSSTALHISWRPPHHETIHGEFLGYRIAYRPRDRGDEAFKEIYIRDPNVESHTIQNLETYTQYLVSLQVFNPEGPGPNTTVLVMTDEGVPSKPRDLTVLEVSSDTIMLRWTQPEKLNGAIEGYRVYYMYNNYTDTNSRIKPVSPYITYNLTNLKPFTEYKIWVKAFTRNHEGEPSDPIYNTTDISGPSSPKLLNLTCQTQDTIFFQWARPEHFYYSIDYYYIYIYLNDRIWKNISIESSTEHLETSYSVENVTTNTEYQVQMQASTRSNRTKRIVRGPLSEPKTVYMRSDCDKMQEYMRHTTHELSAGVLAGVICASFSFLLAVSAFILWRKCFRVSYYYLDDPPCSVPTASLDWNAPPDGNSEHKGAIPVHLFPKHVAELHADGDIGFSKEYEAIQAEATTDEHTSEHSQHPDNRVKNRYLNIIAYDHSRVQLLQMPGQKKNIDYINANYIDGFQWSKAYIGTQGPLPSTFDCFWRMVWEQRVNIIVMITNLVERGRRKCDMYWPKEGTETYGVIQVKLVKEDIMATYTVRTLQIKHLRIKKKKAAMAEKLVYQYHYTNWPDHGTPDHPLPVLHFVKKSAAANPPDAGPIIVHCSAGVGRTGTYIVLDAMLRQIRSRGEVNIFGFLRHIRSQRNFLVQTEEQYIFIHDALVEAIESGETNISREQFPRYVQMLQNLNTEEKSQLWKPIDVQFKLVTSFQCKDFNLVSANKVINQPKNRTANILPVESSRVHLTPKPGEDGSDYVNATWMQGFHSLREFIITQHPLKTTIKDFWQMVWDHNAQTIVMLSIIDNQEFEVFWPMDQETVDADSYKVKLVNEQAQSTYVTRDFTMQSLQDDYEIPVKMIHCTNWPHHCCSIAEIYHLPNTVLDMGIQNGPVVVVDRFGGTEAASFCELTTLKKHLMYDNHVDVYMYAKLYHNKRPGIWGSCDDYLRLHLAVQTLCSPPEGTPDLYAMTNGALNGSLSNDCVRVPPEEAPLISQDVMKCN
ncbi:tyrosine-protein phosphatase 99A isoform X3 [Tribolium castaneum]|uniref:tyrosine-protein phosphatase 99A isoform X3 n=1 Tax=Tribolium castaneum TaxID=7070 RepID=UPI00046BF92D|nr:PREDICTED: tyrosine-protein phosphatase 99A isoform X3 [Tribolium castaneum]|eukprot:XP_008200584.1 PREDICTED: tyrosine-protein phosphatase 99A isoform X3 [Tribolium castaneum]